MQSKRPQPLHKKWTWRKPKGKPKRPLSAYNIFFAHVRQDLMSDRKNKNGIGFQNLAQVVARKWKDLDPTLKLPYIEKANIAKERYKVELSQWEKSQSQWEKPREDSSKNELTPVVQVEVFDNMMANPITPTNNKKHSIASYNDMVSFLQASQQSRFPSASNIDTSRGIYYLYGTVYNPTNEHICAQTMMHDVGTSTRYLPASSDQSQLNHSVGIATACVTPTLHHRHLCSTNNLTSNMLYDDSLEPLPFSNSSVFGQCCSGFASAAEDSEVPNSANCELLHSNDLLRPSAANESTGCHTNTEIDTYNNVPDEPFNNDDPNNYNWNLLQLEKLLRLLETDDWNQFL
jgi:hypothetical protein